MRSVKEVCVPGLFFWATVCCPPIKDLKNTFQGFDGRNYFPDVFSKGIRMFCVLFMFIAGIILGFTVSADLSNHPMFPHASYAFIFFWTVVGGIIGFKVGEELGDRLDF